VVFPDQDDAGLGTLLIPNTVALVAGAPHEKEAKALIDFLLSTEIERKLVESGWCHVPVRPCEAQPRYIEARDVKCMEISLEDVYKHIEQVKMELREFFVK
jgi:iron(III) transport system substrate-binding protein